MDDVTVFLPKISDDEVSEDLRRLTAELDRIDPERTAFGILGGEFGYGSEFENRVFEMHPFWWGDYQCGWEDRENAWLTANPHAADCFQSRIDWTAPPETWRPAAAKLAVEMGLEPYYGVLVHCTCTHDAAYDAWTRTNPHPADCPVVRPNFRYKPTGFEIRWYKYIGRDMEHAPVETDGWRRIIRACLDSIGRGEVLS